MLAANYDIVADHPQDLIVVIDGTTFTSCSSDCNCYGMMLKVLGAINVSSEMLSGQFEAASVIENIPSPIVSNLNVQLENKEKYDATNF